MNGRPKRRSERDRGQSQTSLFVSLPFPLCPCKICSADGLMLEYLESNILAGFCTQDDSHCFCGPRSAQGLKALRLANRTPALEVSVVWCMRFAVKSASWLGRTGLSAGRCQFQKTTWQDAVRGLDHRS